MLRTKIQMLEKLSKTDECFSQLLLFVARKNQLLIKINNSTILMINLK